MPLQCELKEPTSIKGTIVPWSHTEPVAVKLRPGLWGEVCNPPAQSVGESVTFARFTFPTKRVLLVQIETSKLNMRAVPYAAAGAE